MNRFGKSGMFTVALFGALVSSIVSASATNILYAQSGSGVLQTNSGSFTPIAGLQIKLPAANGNSKYALVMLDIPNPYAKGTNFPGGQFGIAADGVVQPLTGVFTYDSQSPQSYGRHPVTVILRVPLTATPQTVTGMWHTIRGSTVITDTPNSLSAIVE
jgi:mannose-binding lectin